MTDTDPPGARSETSAAPKLLVVGLGASAGGIQALRTFFSHVPADSGSAYVVILHLSPDHDSKLAEVLQTSTSIPVTQVTHPVPIEPNHVYVVPPNRRLDITDGTLTLSEMTQREHRRSPVDVFFRALADAYGTRSVCAILSGTGPNGSAGLKRVKEYGGLVLAQSPDEAAYDDMPNNAIATGLVDIVAARRRDAGTDRGLLRPSADQRRAGAGDGHDRRDGCAPRGHDVAARPDRSRFRQLQVGHAAAPPAAPPERRRPVHGERVRAADPRGAVRGGVADEGSADQRHPLLSRSRRVHAARGAGDSAAVRGQASRRPDPGLGARVRDR